MGFSFDVRAQYVNILSCVAYFLYEGKNFIYQNKNFKNINFNITLLSNMDRF